MEAATTCFGLQINHHQGDGQESLVGTLKGRGDITQKKKVKVDDNTVKPA